MMEVQQAVNGAEEEEATVDVQFTDLPNALIACRIPEDLFNVGSLKVLSHSVRRTNVKIFTDIQLLVFVYKSRDLIDSFPLLHFTFFFLQSHHYSINKSHKVFYFVLFIMNISVVPSGALHVDST